MAADFIRAQTIAYFFGYESAFFAKSQKRLKHTGLRPELWLLPLLQSSLQRTFWQKQNDAQTTLAEPAKTQLKIKAKHCLILGVHNKTTGSRRALPAHLQRACNHVQGKAFALLVDANRHPAKQARRNNVVR